MQKHLLAAAVLAATSIGLAFLPSRAEADEEFDVVVEAGKVTVKAKGNWHINEDYPWRFTPKGAEKLDKTKFSLSKTAASVPAPKGEGTVKGGVCSGEQCLRIEKTVVVP